jgi:hypothetical protein
LLSCVTNPLKLVENNLRLSVILNEEARINNLLHLIDKMNSSHSRSLLSQVVEINWADRWSVYRRLQELQIPCFCRIDRPLQVEIHDPTAAIQLWSVVKQVTASRHELIRWLDDCWHKKSNPSE